ncbi:MAG: hypothetical protein H6Q74_1011 [Firmicutes bacterium]|nr:hypothetical protein [Bacillota bacterium]
MLRNSNNEYQQNGVVIQPATPKKANNYEADVPMHQADTLNIAFKDCADNWDNNAGKNYSFDIANY